MFQEFNLNSDSLDDFPSKLKDLLDTQLKEIDKLVESSSLDYDEVIKPLEDMDEERSLLFTPLSHLNSTMNSEYTKEAYEKCIPLLSKFHSEVSQNQALFNKLKSLKTDDEEKSRVLSNDIRDFILSGAELPEDKKRRIEEIDLRLSELSNKFSQNLLDATNAWEMIVENQEDVAGIPESELNRLKFEEDGKTKYRFTLQIPDYLAYITYGPNRELREKIYRAYTTRAPQNGEVIDEILSLRDEKAKILGFDSFADYSLQTKDAKDVESVISFLESLVEISKEQGKKELEELEAFAKELDSIDELRSYDVAYYSEKLKKSLFDYDEAQIKPYFEQNRVLKGLLDIVSELFSVAFQEVDVPTWHESVKVYDIFEDSKISGRIYFDLEARDSKRGGAWMHDWETHFVDSHDRLHLPSAFVVANFPPQSPNQPSLLRHDDVVTLFHEMGHAIHHLFSRVKEHSISGINGVAWDVVEFPSQFLENFAYERDILKRFAIHYKSGESIDDELLDKIKSAKNFQSAMAMLRQLEFALFDFKLHTRLYQGDEVQELLDSVREYCGTLKPPSYNRFQHGFAHIFAGGYAAGYYSYKWAEVLSADAFFSCIESDGSFNKEMARGYKEYILKNGGKKDMRELYREWLNREPDVKSLAKLYDIGDFDE